MEIVDFTCKRPNSQLDPPLVTSLCRLVVVHSMASYVIHKSLLKFLSHANFCRVTQVTQGSHAQVIGQSLISRKPSQVSQRLVASVWQQLGHNCGYGARVYANRLTNGVQMLWAHKSVVVRLQATLITWPVIHFLLTGMSVAPWHHCKC